MTDDAQQLFEHPVINHMRVLSLFFNENLVKSMEVAKLTGKLSLASNFSSETLLVYS